MSGRLIILPKKSYTPWKPENVERVLRDERLDRERKEKQRKEEASKLSSSRIETLKLRKRQNSGRTTDNDVEDDSPTMEHLPQHVNLFENEEKESLTKVTDIISNSKKDVKVKYHETRVFLGDKNKQNPRTKRVISIQSQEKLKWEMDPMNQFLPKEKSQLISTTLHESSTDKLNVSSVPRKQEHDDPKKFCQSDSDGSSSFNQHPKKKKSHTLRKIKRRKHGNKKRRKKSHRGNHHDDRYTESDDSSSTHSSVKSSFKEYKKKRRRKHKHHRRYRKNRSLTQNDSENKGSDISSTSSSTPLSKRNKKSKSRKRNHGHSHNYENNETTNNSSKSSMSMEELRKRRLERETQEEFREAKIRNPGQDRAKPHVYQNQYFPSFTRHYRSDRRFHK